MLIRLARLAIQVQEALKKYSEAQLAATVAFRDILLRELEGRKAGGKEGRKEGYAVLVLRQDHDSSGRFKS